MTVKSEIRELDPVRREMRVTVSEDQAGEAYRAVVRRIARRARIPGFRPGKAPLELVRTRFGDAIRREVLEDLVSRTCNQAFREEEVHPVHVGGVKDVDWEQGGELAYTASFEVAPQVDLGEYRGLRVPKPGSEVSEEEVERRIRSMRESKAVLEPLEREVPEAGDYVLCDFIETPSGEGEEPRIEEDIFLVAGDERNIPELNDALREGRTGETVSFVVPYPQSHPDPRLAGREVAYRVRIKEIKRKVLPEADDDFASEWGVEGGMEGLEARVREDLARAKERWADQAVRDALLDLLLEAHDFPAPPSLVEEEARQALREQIRDILAKGMDPRRMAVDWEDAYRKMLVRADRDVRAHFLLARIAGEQGIGVDAADVDERIQDLASERGVPAARVRADVEKAGALEALKQSILRRKILDFLLEDATIYREED